MQLYQATRGTLAKREFLSDWKLDQTVSDRVVRQRNSVMQENKVTCSKRWLTPEKISQETGVTNESHLAVLLGTYEVRDHEVPQLAAHGLKQYLYLDRQEVDTDAVSKSLTLEVSAEPDSDATRQFQIAAAPSSRAALEAPTIITNKMQCVTKVAELAQELATSTVTLQRHEARLPDKAWMNQLVNEYKAQLVMLDAALQKIQPQLDMLLCEDPAEDDYRYENIVQECGAAILLWKQGCGADLPKLPATKRPAA